MKSLQLKLLPLVFIVLLFCLTTQQLNAQKADSLRVYFESGKKHLDTFERNKIDSKFMILETKNNLEIQILGYCDDIGNEASNWKLSEQRAKYIKDIVPSSISRSETKINILAMGEVQPDVFLENIDSLRRENRSVLIRLIYTEESEKVSDPMTKPVIFSDDLKIGDYIVIEGIHFIGGRHQPLQESNPHLKDLVKALEKYSEYDFMIQGHICCQTGGTDGLDKDTGIYNLSFARAEAVYKYLVRNGIPAERLQFEGLKHDYPTGKGSKYDRRVELLVTGKR